MRCCRGLIDGLHEPEAFSRADLRPEGTWSSVRANIRPGKANLKHEWADFRLERPDLRPESPDLRPERPGQNNQTDKRTKVPCVLQDFVPFGASA